MTNISFVGAVDISNCTDNISGWMLTGQNKCVCVARGYGLWDGECIFCADKHRIVKQSSSGGSNSCRNCEEGYIETENDECKKCPDNSSAVYSSGGWSCKCNDEYGQVTNDSEEMGFVCATCPTGAIINDEHKCVCDTSNGYRRVARENGVFNFICTKCPTGTIMDENTGTCVCDKVGGYTKIGNECKKCTDIIGIGAIVGDDGTCVCDTKNGYGKNIDGKCVDCSGKGPGMGLDSDGYCVCKKTGYGWQNNGCFLCPINTYSHEIETYDGKRNECKSCDSGYFSVPYLSLTKSSFGCKPDINQEGVSDSNSIPGYCGFGGHSFLCNQGTYEPQTDKSCDVSAMLNLDGSFSVVLPELDYKNLLKIYERFYDTAELLANNGGNKPVWWTDSTARAYSVIQPVFKQFLFGNSSSNETPFCKDYSIIQNDSTVSYSVKEKLLAMQSLNTYAIYGTEKQKKIALVLRQYIAEYSDKITKSYYECAPQFIAGGASVGPNIYNLGQCGNSCGIGTTTGTEGAVSKRECTIYVNIPKYCITPDLCFTLDADKFTFSVFSDVVKTTDVSD